MNYSVDEWRSRILAGWEKWGTGEPLNPKTVEHLAREFAKPLMPEPKHYDFDGRWPWDHYGISHYNLLGSIHRTMFIPWWWTDSASPSALVKEGPKSIVLVKP